MSTRIPLDIPAHLSDNDGRTTIKWEDLPPWRDFGAKEDGRDISDLIDLISHAKASAAEARIYAALVEMGWTPPSDDKQGTPEE